MSLSIGSLVGYLELDDTKFQAKADKADKTLSGLELQLKALESAHPEIDLGTAGATAKIDDLRSKLTDLRAKSAEGADIRVDAVAAMMKLDALKSEMRSLAREAETPHEVDLDILPALTKLELLRAKLGSVTTKAAGAVGGWSPSWLAVGLFGVALPMALPMLTVAAGLLGAIGSAALGAAAGVGVLKMAFDGVGSSISAYEQYQTAMAAATTKSQRQAAEYAFKTSAYSTGSPQTQAFTRMYVNKVRPGLQHTQQAAQTATLPGVTAGIGAALPVLGAVDGAVTKLGHSLGTLADAAGHSLNSPFWKQWITWLGNAGSKDTHLLGVAGGNLLTGLATSLERFSPLGMGFLQWLDKITANFAKWTAGNGFERFLRDVHTDGAAVAQFFSSAGPVILNLLKGMSSAGIGELQVFGSALQLISNIGSPEGVQLLGTLLPSLLISAKVAQGVKALAVAMGLFDTAADANPVGMIVIALATLIAVLIKARNETGSWTGVWEAGLRGAAKIFLWFVGMIVDGAAKAFGWIPGLGGKLQTAANEFATFRNRVNAEMDGIHTMKSIYIVPKVTVPFSSTPAGTPAALGSIIDRRMKNGVDTANGPVHIHVHLGGKEIHHEFARIARQSAANDRAYAGH